jgi:phospholipid/cholesterol/gamma-HCH transport system permease protein
MDAADLPTLVVDWDDGGQGSRRVQLRGRWQLAALRPRWQSLTAQLSREGGRPGVVWDATAVRSMDTVAVALLWRSWGRRRPEQLRLRPEQEALFADLDTAVAPVLRPFLGPHHLISLVGRGALAVGSHARDGVALFGRLALDLLAVAVRAARLPWREVSAQVYHTGLTALPITALVGFLIGVVVSYLSSQQLRTFGADVFIIDLLGMSVLRELGPLLAAILVAGRSGSSMTAELGVMRLTQELDAMHALGIPVSLRLVMPRVVALALALPLLVLWTDALAMTGGILAAQNELGIGFALFVDKLPAAVGAGNLLLGLVKGVVFGCLIALVACHYGLRIEPHTRSLGRGTTRSVVAAITTVIIADAVFAVVTSRLGIP